jgi:thymidylate kinase
VRPKLKKGGIVLSDRYIYDLRYIYKDRPMNQFNFMRRLVCRFFPSPNRIVYLYNTAEIIRSRKPQLGADEIRQFQGFYQKALANHPVMDIKTDQPPEVLAQRIVKSIMSYYLGQNSQHS